MAIQISGSTIINNSKQIQNIGGKGGIISGTFTIGGPQGFGWIRCNVFRGHVIGFVSFDTADSNDSLGAMAASLGWSKSSGSDSFNAHTLKQQANNIAFVYPPATNSQFTFNVSNYYTTRTVYYSFWYSGNTVPTITIAN